MTKETISEQVFSAVRPLRDGGSGVPVFLIHGVGGVLPECPELIAKISASHPVYGILSQAFDPILPPRTTLEDMAAYYLDEIQRTLGAGPFFLLGFSFGGMVAFEMAQQMIEAGQAPPLIGMIDATEMSYLRRSAKTKTVLARVFDFYQRLQRRLREAIERPNTVGYVKQKLESRMYRLFYSFSSKIKVGVPISLHAPYHINWFAALNYMPRIFAGRIVLYKAKGHFWEPGMPADLGWGALAPNGVTILEVPGDHETMFSDPAVSILADYLNDTLASEVAAPPFHADPVPR